MARLNILNLSNLAPAVRALVPRTHEAAPARSIFGGKGKVEGGKQRDHQNPECSRESVRRHSAHRESSNGRFVVMRC